MFGDYDVYILYAMLFFTLFAFLLLCDTVAVIGSFSMRLAWKMLHYHWLTKSGQTWLMGIPVLAVIGFLGQDLTGLPTSRYLGGVGICGAAAFLFIFIRPPAVIVLASSRLETGALLNLVVGGIWPHRVVALLDRGRTGSGIMEIDNLRTRDADKWLEVVHGLTDFVPVVVVDARRDTKPVVEEVAWMLSPERRHRAVFVVGKDRECAALEANGVSTASEHIRSITQPDLPYLLRLLKRSGHLVRRWRQGDFADSVDVAALDDLHRVALPIWALMLNQSALICATLAVFVAIWDLTAALIPASILGLYFFVGAIQRNAGPDRVASFYAAAFGLSTILGAIAYLQSSWLFTVLSVLTLLVSNIACLGALSYITNVTPSGWHTRMVIGDGSAEAYITKAWIIELVLELSFLTTWVCLYGIVVNWNNLNSLGFVIVLVLVLFLGCRAAGHTGKEYGRYLPAVHLS